MKAYNVKVERGNAVKATLPAGLYEAKIIQAKVERTQRGGEVLVIAYDIAEGDEKDFFKRDFDSRATDPNRKWRGIYRLFLPTDDGSEQDERNKKTLGTSIWAIEDSNDGFHFDWDERHLVGKAVGVNIRNKEYDFNGITGWTTECGKLESVKDIRDGTVKVMKDRPLRRVVGDTATPGFSSSSGGYADFGGAAAVEYPF